MQIKVGSIMNFKIDEVAAPTNPELLERQWIRKEVDSNNAVAAASNAASACASDDW